MKSFLLFISVALLLVIGAEKTEAIKIGLQDKTPQTIIAASDGGVIINNETGAPIGSVSKMKPYKFKASGNSVIFISDNDRNMHTSSVTLVPDGGFVSVKKKWYRGKLIIVAKKGKLTVINDVDLESYLKGVVPSEMPSKWDIEAHKAQAIAARSYAIANLGKRGASGYDLKDTPEDQAYGGASAETRRTTKAVKDTKGIVLTYDKKIIPAYYHASSGGHTVNSGKVWNTDLPYLRAVPAFDNSLAKNGHGVGMSQNGANNLAQKGYNAYQILMYFYNNINFAKLRPEWVL